MINLKKYTTVLAMTLALACACGNESNIIKGASNSDVASQAAVTAEDQSTEYIDFAIDQNVTLKVSIEGNECCIREISAKETCSKIVIPEKINGLPVTSMEYFKKNDDDTTYNIFGVMNNNSDCDEAASEEEMFKANNKNIKEIVLPDTIGTIADSAFQGLVGLKKIHLPKKLTKLQKYTFARCTKLQRIDLPKNVKSIDMRAFDLCHNLSRIHIKKGNKYFVEKKGMIIKKSNMSLFTLSGEKKSIVIPKNVKGLETGAFDFFAPKKIKVSKKNKYIKQKNNCLYLKKNKKLIAVTSNKKNLVRIPNGVKMLGEKICCIGYVDKVIIPKSVKYWCEYWYYNFEPKNSGENMCIIHVKGKKAPIVKGNGADAIPWNCAYRLNKKYFKRFNKLFKKYDRGLKWSKIYKAYVCE